MVCFNKTIPGIQEAFQIVRNRILTKESITAEETTRLHDILKHVAKAEHDRLFVIMSAQAKGWAFAKELDFYRSGKGFSSFLTL